MGASKSTIATNESNERINDKNNAFNAEQAELNRQFQVEQTNAQNQWNLDLWNKNNEYNSPSAQIKRLQEAGINPNMYSAITSGGSTTASSSSTASGSQASSSGAAAMQDPNTFGKTIQLLDSLVNGSSALASSFFGNTQNAAQTRLINANAKAQEIQNMRTQAQDNTLGNSGIYMSYDGQLTTASEYNNMPSNEQANYHLITSSNRLTDDKGKPQAGGNLGALDAARTISSMFNMVHSDKASVLQSNLVSTIYGEQFKSPAVIQAMVNMPTKQFEKLNADVANAWQALKNAGVTHDLLLDEHKMNHKQLEVLDEQLDSMRNSNINKWFNDVSKKDHDISFKDVMRGLIIGFSQFAPNLSISKNLK